MGKIVKDKVDELEEDIREGFLSQLRKELTGVVQGVSRNKRFLVNFQDGREMYITTNKLTVVIVENRPMEK